MMQRKDPKTPRTRHSVFLEQTQLREIEATAKRLGVSMSKAVRIAWVIARQAIVQLRHERGGR